MDPPYNISFRSNFQVGMDAEDQETGETIGGVPQDPVTIKAFRDNYRNGVHSYLDGLYDQFKLARELLADDGSIIVQIGPDNVHQVAVLMSEVFGVENHVATIPYRTTSMVSGKITEIGNWLVWYAKTTKDAKYRQLYRRRDTTEVIIDRGGRVRYEQGDGTARELTEEEILNPKQIAREQEKLFITSSLTSSTQATPIAATHSTGTKKGNRAPEHPDAYENHHCSASCHEAVSSCPKGQKCGPLCHSNAYPCPQGRQWRVSLSGLHAIAARKRLVSQRSAVMTKIYESEQVGAPLIAMWNDAGSVRDKQYIVETPARVLERCLLMTTDPGDLVLDLTCGSGAMPIQAETWGRRWIATDVSQVSIAIARERLLTTTYPAIC